ncbi:hypothetical protein CRYUN_Cryun19dG0060400 [Craigia yunnanensis]
MEVDKWVGASGKNGMRRYWLIRSHVTGQPKRTDLDMSHHVNNVKYVNWMLEIIPEIFLEGYQLFSITLEYRRECGSSDMVQSLCQPYEDRALQDGVQDDNGKNYKGHLQASELEGDTAPRRSPLCFTHLIQMKADSKTEEIVRGRTTWKRKP